MNISSKNKHRLRETALAVAALVLIAGALALTFSHVLLSGPEDIAGRYDVFRYYAPITFYLDFCLSQGELPLWNPMVYCGLPNAANPQAFVFYPLNLLRSVLLGTISPQATNESLIVFIGLHLLFMGFTTYTLGRAHKLSFPGALTAALAWVCSALIVRRACEYHFLYTMAWLPLILILVKAAIDTRHTRLKMAFCLVAGMFFGLSILGGFIQIVNYMGVSIAFYALLYKVTTAEPTVGEGWRKRFSGFAVEGFSFALLLGIAGLIALVLLLPTMELAPYSTRDKGTTVSMYSDIMSWDITRLYQSLVVYPGTRWEPETIRMAGITALLLAAAGCFNRRRKLVALFGLIAYVLIDCSFGPPFPVASLVNIFTPFSSSAYSRGFDFALLPLGLLAGLGVDTLINSARNRRHRHLLALVLLYVGGATLIPLWRWTHPHEYLTVGPWVVVIPALALAFMLLLAWAPLRGRAALVLGFALPVFFVAETLSWNAIFVPWMIKRHLVETPPPQSGHHFPETNQRWTDPIPNRTLYSMTPAMNGVDPLHLGGMRQFVSGQFREKLNKREVRDWEPTAENTRGNLLLKRFFWLAPSYSVAPMPDKTSLFSPTEVVYLEEDPGQGVRKFEPGERPFQSVSPGAIRVDIPGATTLRNTAGANQQHALRFSIPKEVNGKSAGSSGALHATLVYHYTGSISAQIDTIFVDEESGRRQWGLRHRVAPSRMGEGVLEVPVPDFSEGTAEITIKGKGAGNIQLTDAYLMVDVNDLDSAITLQDFSANRVQLAIAALESPTLFLFADADYPGWQAWVDGVETPILKADSEFKAIALPAGAHEVLFEFRPKSVRSGMILSLLSFVFAVVVVMWLYWTHRRETRRTVVVDVAPSAVFLGNVEQPHEAVVEVEGDTLDLESDASAEDEEPGADVRDVEDQST